MLKKLELIGFKSFAGKTTLDFAPGITAIVGPNGSGKSNVIDALRWLLGERDAKHLRGGKVGDLIFAGTPKKPRVGMAEARVYFDNSTQFFPVDYSEVVVSREVNRGGVSKYFLNNAEVRLRDLVDFFAKARLGVRGLVVIGQGESDTFLKATPLERREMVEEVLGLREYQLKRAEAERKAEATTANLAQVDSLLKEITPHLKALKRQTARWERRGELEESLRSLESSFFNAKLAEIHQNFSTIRPQLAVLEEKIKSTEQALEKAQQDVQKTESSDSTHHKELKTLKNDVNALMHERGTREKEAGRLEAQLEFLREREADAETEIDVARAVPFLKRLKAVFDELIGANLDEVHAALRALRVELSGVFKARKAEGMTLAEAEERHRTITAELASLGEKARALYEREHELTGTIEAQSGEFKKALAAREAARDAVKAIETEQNKILFEEERWKLKQQDLEGRARLAGFAFPKGEASAVPTDIDFARVERDMLRLNGELASMGEVDEALIKEARETEERHTFLTSQSADLAKALTDLTNLKEELETKITTEFQAAMANINNEFQKYFELMFGGGKASLVVRDATKKTRKKKGEEIEDAPEEEEKEPELGIDINVSIPRKRISGLEMLSGGERSLVSTAVLFALVSVSPPPFLVLDEMDAALDERNARRFADMLKALSQKTQFVIVTHNRATMESAHTMYGITMADDGTSKVLSLKLD